MNKTRVKTLLVVILLILTGCNNSNEIEMNELEMEIFKNIRDAEFGARSPKLLYGTEKYALILDVEGLIIYDISRGKVNQLIDTKAEGFNKLQGSVITEAIGRDDYVLLKNLGDETKYLEINLRSGKNKIIFDKDEDGYEESEAYELTEVEMESIKLHTLDECQAIRVGKKIIVFVNDYGAHDKDWRLIVFNKENLDKIDVFKIFDLENSKIVDMHDSEVEMFWDIFPDGKTDNNEDLYWRHIDDGTKERVDYLIESYGIDVLFKGLKSDNLYSQYYSINRLLEFYNDDEIRSKGAGEIKKLLNSDNEKIRKASEFALSILTKKFDSPYILRAINDIKIFTLFNNYSDYGSQNEIWIIENDELSRLCSFEEPQTYISKGDSIILSPGKEKITVQTCSRRSSSFNIIDLKTRETGPEMVKIALGKVARDNTNYINTYPNGEYSWGNKLKWIDDNMVEFNANLAYNYGEIIRDVSVKYNHTDDCLEYK